MKILYAIQATGNGHISRANEIIPYLQNKCDLDILISGTQADVQLNYPIKYKRKGLSFVFGKKGGIDFYKTFKLFESKQFIKEIKNLPVEAYDLVLNDFEPISAWACKIKKIPCISLSHQYGVTHPNAPKPSKFDPFALFILKHYAPCNSGIGFHFKNYAPNIFTPVIKKEIREATTTTQPHYTVYLPAYADKKIIAFCSQFPAIHWQVFSKHSKKSYTLKNCSIQPVDTKAFNSSFINCTGILCGAGFETPAEAIYMGKKLLVIPMKQQYEQHCNAAGAASLGITVIKSLKQKHIPVVQNWLEQSTAIQIPFENQTNAILDMVLLNFSNSIAEKKPLANMQANSIITLPTLAQAH
jgi:uncharacterized protein (TIGR00661 family)